MDVDAPMYMRAPVPGKGGAPKRPTSLERSDLSTDPRGGHRPRDAPETEDPPTDMDDIDASSSRSGDEELSDPGSHQARAGGEVVGGGGGGRWRGGSGEVAGSSA